jgi:hypothetical protein
VVERPGDKQEYCITNQYKEIGRILHNTEEMTAAKRIGNKWTVNEILALQREFQLLEWDLDRIAAKHGRTVQGIMHKLDKEGFAHYNVLYSNYHPVNSLIPIDMNDDLEVEHDEEEEEDLLFEDDDDEDYVYETDNDDDDDDDDANDDGDDDDGDDGDDEEHERSSLNLKSLAKRVAALEASLDDIKHLLKEKRVAVA